MIALWRTVDYTHDPTGNAGAEVSYRILNADGSFAEQEFNLTGYSPGQQTEPSITQLADGRIVVVWQTTPEGGTTSTNTWDIKGGYFQIEDNGTLSQLGQTFDVNLTKPSVQKSPEVIATADGGFNIVWSSYDSDNSNAFSGYDVVTRHFYANGVSTTETTLASGDQTYDHDPKVATLPNGNLVMTWFSSIDNLGTQSSGKSDIEYGIYDQLGNTVFQGTIPMTDPDLQSGYHPEIAVDPETGDFVVLWEYKSYQADGGEVNIAAQRFTSEGIAVSGPAVIYSQDTIPQTLPVATFLADGSMIAVWRNQTSNGPFYYELVGAIFKQDGSVIDFMVTDVLQPGATELDISATADGGFMVVWNGQFGYTQEIIAQRFDANGNPVSQIVPIQPAIDPDQTLIGNNQNNTLIGGTGNDTIKGQRGNDILDGDAGNDVISGGRGRDTITGGSGEDVLKGGRGNDRIFGGDDDDILIGGHGKDTLMGDAGDDRLYGGRGRDLLSGGDGDDVIKGGRGRDTINGGTGSDMMDGGAGKDIITGGADMDIFVFKKGNGIDIVTDFSLAQDFLAVVEDLNLSDDNILDHITFSQTDSWIQVRSGTDVLTLNLTDAASFYDSNASDPWIDQMLENLNGDWWSVAEYEAFV